MTRPNYREVYPVARIPNVAFREDLYPPPSGQLGMGPPYREGLIETLSTFALAVRMQDAPI